MSRSPSSALLPLFSGRVPLVKSTKPKNANKHKQTKRCQLILNLSNLEGPGEAPVFFSRDRGPKTRGLQVFESDNSPRASVLKRVSDPKSPGPRDAEGRQVAQTLAQARGAGKGALGWDVWS